MFFVFPRIPLFCPSSGSTPIFSFTKEQNRYDIIPPMGLMDNLKQLGDLKKMRDQAMEVQKKLAGIKITVEHRGVTVVMTADQKVVSISGESDFGKITEAVNEALKQSQKVAADEMKPMMGGLGLPGM